MNYHTLNIYTSGKTVKHICFERYKMKFLRILTQEKYIRTLKKYYTKNYYYILCKFFYQIFLNWLKLKNIKIKID